MQSASDIYTEAESREQDLANQLLKAPYGGGASSRFSITSRLGADKAVAGMFVYCTYRRQAFVKYPTRFNPRAAGARDVPNIIGDYVIGVTRAKDDLTNVQERFK